MLWARKPRLVDEVGETLLHYLKERGLTPPASIELDAGLKDFGLDSLDAVALVAELERRFNLALNRDQAAQVRDVRALVELVASAQATIKK